MSDETKDTRPYMSTDQLLDFLNLLTDAELKDPDRIKAKIDHAYQASDWQIKTQSRNVLSSRQAKREAVEIAVCLQDLTGEDWQTLPAGPAETKISAAAGQYRIGLNFAHYDTAEGRILVSPEYDRDCNGNRHNLTADDYQSITVSRKRSPAAIAADINRRILSWYRARQDQNREGIKAQNARLSAKEARASLVIEIAGPEAEVMHPAHGRWSMHRKKGDPVMVEIGKHGGPVTTAELTDYGTMTLKIKGVSLETGLELLQMLKTIRQAEELAQAEQGKQAGF